VHIQRRYSLVDMLLPIRERIRRVRHDPRKPATGFSDQAPVTVTAVIYSTGRSMLVCAISIAARARGQRRRHRDQACKPDICKIILCGVARIVGVSGSPGPVHIDRHNWAAYRAAAEVSAQAVQPGQAARINLQLKHIFSGAWRFRSLQYGAVIRTHY